MDDKGGRRRKLAIYWRKPENVKHIPGAIARLLITNRQATFTGALLIALTVLLFGIVSLFPAPATNTQPYGVTVIDYSTFVQQVKAGNVLAIEIQGQHINGLLKRDYATGKTSARTPMSVPMATANSQAGGIDSWRRQRVTPSMDPARSVYTIFPAHGDAHLMPLLLSKHVTVTAVPDVQPAAWAGLLWKFIPIVFLVLLLSFSLIPHNEKSSGSSQKFVEQIRQMAKSKARRYDRAKESIESQSHHEKAMSSISATQGPSTFTIPQPLVTFADVAGIDEVRSELEEIVQFLRDPQQFERLGARLPRGALLVGPPGTGKTLLAKAVAGEAGVPFLSISASEFVEMFVGVGASRVRDLFQQARQSAPCVIFIDELDAVGRKRSIRVSGSDERDQTLNQLLVEMDGFDEHKAVIVLAATNRADILDKALLRPGRFDRRVVVSYPDRAGREAILKVHTRRTPLHEEVSLERLARLTTGMSGAELANLVNEAALLAARHNLEQLNQPCFEQALARVQLGALRPLVMSEHDRRVIAYHEGGHALVAYHLPQADGVNAVTILPRGQSLGVTQFIAEEDRYNYSRDFLMARIAVGLGGRVAEELTFGPEQVTTGAENDLQVVTELARRMVTRWGMSQQVGVLFADYQAGADGTGLNMSRSDLDLGTPHSRSLVLDANGQPHLNGHPTPQRRAFAMSMSAPAASGSSSASLAALIDMEVQRILNEGCEMARSVLMEHADHLQKLADTLMEREHLNRKEFEALFV